MKKIELLSPAGSINHLYQAVMNGADAVYLAGYNYGARKFSQNFSKDELKEAVRYCHLYGTSVYVTVNTLIFEDEIIDFIHYIEYLYNIGVDALIMQDIGMIDLVNRTFPNFPIHASTQCHTYSDDSLSFLHTLGCKRAVMAREMTKEDINNCKTNIEKEIFAYGALCVCYSGLCLFSSLNGGRSGNRGSCIGSCRLPYKLYCEKEYIPLKDKYLLSMKDLNTLNNINDILQLNINSLKIEGRMKSPYYVGYVTRLFRKFIDSYYEEKPLKLTKEELTNLELLFNREFTEGYLYSNNVINMKNPNHQGIKIGHVIKTTKDKIYMMLDKELKQGDGIRFKESNLGMIVNKLYNKDLMLINKTNKGLAITTNKVGLKNNDTILKTISKNLLNDLSILPQRKIKTSIKVQALVGEKLSISIDDGKHIITKNGNIVSHALKRSISTDDIKKKIGILGNSPFTINKIDIIKDDNIFINLSEIKKLRRELVSELIDLRTSITRKPLKIDNNNLIKDIYLKKNTNYYLGVLARNEEQIKACIDTMVDYIYITDYDLYCKYKKYSNVYYQVNRVDNENHYFKNERLLIGDSANIVKYKDNNTIIGDYFLNITNSHTSNYFLKFTKRVTLSVELDLDKINKISKRVNNLELIVYGKPDIMVTRSCILKNTLNYCNKCKNNSKDFYLEGYDGKKYKIIYKNCFNYIINSYNFDKYNDISLYKEMGINYFRILFLDENYEMCKKIIKKYKNVL